MDDDSSTLDADLVRARVREELFGAHTEPVRVGRYRLLGRLGAGAMGVVYAAHDPTLDRRVALKLGKSGAATEQQLRRATREAQALAKLSHPNVVTVHDVGMHDGRLFVAMELVDGETLGAWMRRASRPWRDVLAVVEEAGRGLAAAHAQGLVHRDVKPENVLVTRDGRAKVLDFGLVRPADALVERLSAPDADARPLEARITDTVAMLGTPAYMAPEQLEGPDVDARADQYGLCATLYEALYGVLPHPTDTPAALTASLLHGAARTPPRGTDVPASVERALMRGLSRRPEDRFDGIDALLAALRPPPTRRVAPWLATLLVALLVVAGIAALVATSAATPAPPMPTHAVALPVTVVADAGTAPPPARGEELDTGPFVRDVVRRCWRYHQDAHPDAAVTPVSFTLRVAPSGEIVEVHADSHADAPELLACIETRGRDWQGFERADHERTTTHAVLLRPDVSPTPPGAVPPTGPGR